jgi:alpha,alpha-trehalase
MVRTQAPTLTLVIALFGVAPSFCQMLPVPENLWRLEKQEDTDGDKRITIHDAITPFLLQDRQGQTLQTVTNVYELSVLLQELKRAEECHEPEIGLDSLRLNENVVRRTHRLIKDFYWDALTRRIDASHLDQVLPDSKVRSKCDFLYVPSSDDVALRYFRQCEQKAIEQKRSPSLQVVALPSPARLTGTFVRDLDGEHGLLSLAMQKDSSGNVSAAIPYVVPGGRFNELYYWDSYFIVLGLLADGRKDLARAQADNLLYELQAFGRIPNANRTYYLTRSQPPLLTSVVRAVYEAKAADKLWLAAALKSAIVEYQNVWMAPGHLVTVGTNQLNRYFDDGEGPCPEVEPGHYDEKIKPWLLAAAQAQNSSTTKDVLTPERFLNQNLYCRAYANIAVNGLTLESFFRNDRALRESGHDTTHRFDDRTTDFLPCDLNALLFKYEMDFAQVLQNEFGGTLPGVADDTGKTSYWRQRAAVRKAAMNELMWDQDGGFYFDYDFANRKRSTYISATGLFPLWAGLLDPHDPRDQGRARRLVDFAQQKLEQFSGLAATARESVEAATSHDARQWDYPYGWPPHQMLAWQALHNFGMQNVAEELAYRWLYTIARNAHDFNGTIPEKYNVVTGSHDAFVEYGNVGTKFAYIAPEGFGWMNASFQVGLRLLSPERLKHLEALQPPPQAGP